MVDDQTLRPPLKPALDGFRGINRYWDKTNECYAAKILPGEYYVTLHDEAIVTVLGSCVSACIRDKVFGIGLIAGLVVVAIEVKRVVLHGKGAFTTTISCKLANKF